MELPINLLSIATSSLNLFLRRPHAATVVITIREVNAQTCPNCYTLLQHVYSLRSINLTFLSLFCKIPINVHINIIIFRRLNPAGSPSAIPIYKEVPFRRHFLIFPINKYREAVGYGWVA